MTATAPAPTKTHRLPLGGEPRVQLLPPAVREREKARGALRLGVLLVVLGIVIAGALGGFGFLRAMTTGVALDDANARTSDLHAQRLQYLEATQVTTTSDFVRETQTSMTSYEIDLAELLAALQGRLGAGMALTEFTAEVQPPWGVPLTGEDVLAPPRIANFEIAISSTSVAEATAFRDSLQSIRGFASVALLETNVGTDGVVVTRMSLALATDAVSNRFIPESDDAATDEEG